MPVPLRADFDAAALRAAARRSKNAAQARRLLALAAVYDGGRRTDAARIGGVISADIAPGRHAALLLDQAGWHLSPKLLVPDNITIVPLPAKCPELNPQENVWQFMRDNWLSNCVFLNADDLVDHCCDAWNKLEEQPWRIMSIGLRDWAHGF